MRIPKYLLLPALAIALIGSAALAFSIRTPEAPISCGGEKGGVGCAIDGIVPPAVVGAAPDFTLPTLSGETVTLSYLLAEKPVILDFWASWCPHCQRNMPKLDALYKNAGGSIEIIGINMKEDEETARRFIEANDISYPIVLDGGDVATSYGIRFTNTHVLIRKDGTILKVLAGDVTDADIQALLAP